MKLTIAIENYNNQEVHFCTKDCFKEGVLSQLNNHMVKSVSIENEETDLLAQSCFPLGENIESFKISARLAKHSSFNFSRFLRLRDISFRFSHNPSVSDYPPYVQSVDFSQTHNDGYVFDFGESKALKDIKLQFAHDIGGVIFPAGFDGRADKALMWATFEKNAFLDFSKVKSDTIDLSGLDLRLVSKITFPESVKRVIFNATDFNKHMTIDLSNISGLEKVEGYSLNSKRKNITKKVKVGQSNDYLKQCKKIILAKDISGDVLQQATDFFANKNTKVVRANGLNMAIINAKSKMNTR